MKLESGEVEIIDQELLVKSNEMEANQNANETNREAFGQVNREAFGGSNLAYLFRLALVVVLVFAAAKVWKHKRLIRIKLLNVIRRFGRAD